VNVRESRDSYQRKFGTLYIVICTSICGASSHDSFNRVEIINIVITLKRLWLAKVLTNKHLHASLSFWQLVA
jgi:hypothetical protein